MLGMPAPTSYDLRFRLMGIPVYVTPWFWLVMAILGWDPHSPLLTLIFVGCAFVSILIHELGHGLTAQAFGDWPEIALYQMGGLCNTGKVRLTPGQRLAILACGPGAQFALLAAIVAVGGSPLGISWRGGLFLVKTLLGLGPDDFHGATEHDAARATYGLPAYFIYVALVEINLYWPLLNLLPIWPLDGGQIAGILLTKVDRFRGPRWAHLVSVVMAGVLIAYVLGHSDRGLSDNNTLFRVLLLGNLAFINYQILQAYHQGAYYEREDRDDWWRR